MNPQLELTILMPCLNEEETIGICVKKAIKFLKSNKISGEVLVADNGSTDKSQEIALNMGARLITVKERGYGMALLGGIKASKSKYVIMGDADDSYDFSNLMPFIKKLRSGFDLVMGNRFKGKIEPKSMPTLHRYFGNPVLSFLGRLFYESKVGDFHCGLRGFSREAILGLDLQTMGMEFASEIVVQAELHKLRIAEVPIILFPDGRSRPPHLRSWHDGWRHLRFLLMYSPKWLFLYPGSTLFIIGFILMFLLFNNAIVINNIVFDIHTMLYAAGMMISGLSIVMFALFTNIYARQVQFIPQSDTAIARLEKITLEKGLIIGLALFLIGVALSIYTLIIWEETKYGSLNPQNTMRLTIPALVCIISGINLCFSSFFIGILNIERK